MLRNWKFWLLFKDRIMLELHPLLDEDKDGLKNKHYKLSSGRQAIQDVEDEFTVSDMIAVCRFNVAKYGKRSKNQDQSDLNKLIAYGRYKDSLLSLKNCGQGDNYVTNANELLKMEWRYQ